MDLSIMRLFENLKKSKKMGMTLRDLGSRKALVGSPCVGYSQKGLDWIERE